MKNFFILFLFLFVLGVIKGNAQADTLVTRQKQKIPCKILELSETEVKYKKANYLDGPTFTMDKDRLHTIIYANGDKELVKEDEMSVNQTFEIIDKRQAVKVEPFAPSMDKFVVGYERCLKVGFNLEFKAGLINTSLSDNHYGGNRYYTTGAFFKGGGKFLLGQDYYIKGMKYAHPLKGRYIRLEAIVSSFNIHNKDFYYSTQTSGTYGPVYQYNQEKTDVSITAAAFMINYGRQFILGNVMTLDYYVGIGYGGSWQQYSNPHWSNQRNYETLNTYYFYSHTSLGASGVCVNAGLSIGIVFK